MKRRKLVPYWDENTCSQVSKSTIAEINNNDRAFVRFIFKICLEIFINAYTPCKQRGKQNGFLVITKQADFCIISCNIVVALVAPILPVSNFFLLCKDWVLLKREQAVNYKPCKMLHVDHHHLGIEHLQYLLLS